MVPIMEDIADLLMTPGSVSNYAEALKIDRRIREVKAFTTKPASYIGLDATEAETTEFMRLVWYVRSEFHLLLALHLGGWSSN